MTVGGIRLPVSSVIITDIDFCCLPVPFPPSLGAVSQIFLRSHPRSVILDGQDLLRLWLWALESGLANKGAPSP